MDLTNTSFIPEYISSIISLLSILSNRCNINTFTIFVDPGQPVNRLSFHKFASNSGLLINFHNGSMVEAHYHRNAYLVLSNNQQTLEKVLESKPELVVLVKFANNRTSTLPINLRSVTIPWMSLFFLVEFHRSSSDVGGRCMGVYRPVKSMTARIVHVMYHDGTNWVNNITDSKWHLYQGKIFKNLTDVVIKIYLEKIPGQLPNHTFLLSPAVFFWWFLRSLYDFRIKLVIKQMPNDSMYREILPPELIKETVDALSTLPLLTADRAEDMGYVPTGMEKRFHFIIGSPKYEYSWLSVMKPYSTVVWICLGLTVAVASGMLNFVTRTQGVDSNASSYFVIVIGFICGQACPRLPKTVAGRMACLSALIFSYLTYQFYVTSFFSLVSTRVAAVPFESMEEFVEKKTHALIMLPTTALYADMKAARGGILKRLWDEFIGQQHNQTDVFSFQKALEKVCNEDAVILGLTNHFLPRAAPCQIFAMEPGYFPQSVVLATRKSFPFLPQFKYTLLRTLDSGSMRKIETFFIIKKPLIKKSVTKEPISAAQLSLAIIFYVSSVILSIVLLSLELLFYHRAHFLPGLTSPAQALRLT